MLFLARPQQHIVDEASSNTLHELFFYNEYQSR